MVWGGVGKGKGACGCREWGGWRVLMGTKFLSGVITCFKFNVLKLIVAIVVQLHDYTKKIKLY